MIRIVISILICFVILTSCKKETSNQVRNNSEIETISEILYSSKDILDLFLSNSRLLIERGENKNYSLVCAKKIAENMEKEWVDESLSGLLNKLYE